MKLHGQKSAQWTMRDGLVSGKIISMYEDRAGALWIGTESGLSRFDGQRFANYSTVDGLSDNSVHAITQDAAGDFWFGTTAGLNRFRGGEFTSFFRRNGLPSDQVHTLLAGTNGVLWIGTLDGGLSRFSDGRFVNYAVKHGLPDNSITVILDDGLGYLWLGTGRGICRVAHSELEAFAQGLRPRIECVTCLKKDGLASIQCSAGNPSGISARDGRLWFATAGGVSVVDPRRIRSNPVPPLVVIEEVSIDGEVVFSNRRADGTSGGAEPAALQVPAGRRHVEIAYTGLSFTSPTQTRFRIQLAGFDQGWRDFGTRRIAYYDGLPPGAYRFRVVAANNDGVWSDSSAALAFTVMPYYWQTWWFRSGAAAGLAGVVLLSFRRRIVRLERDRTAEALRLQGAALACAGDGVLITDRHGDIVWTNPALTRLTGYPADEIAGRNVRLLKSGKHPAEFYAAMWKTLLAGEVWQAEIINRNKDGSLSTYEQTTTPVRDQNGKVTHFIAIKRDITERKRMEQAQQRIQLLEQHNALETERSRIARDMHDEMGASLTKITLLSDAAKLKLPASRDMARGSRCALPWIPRMSREVRVTHLGNCAPA